MQFFQAPQGALFATEATLLALFLIIILVGLTARYFRLPYTTILVLAGLGIELLGFVPTIQLTPELVLLLILPPLAFEAAFHLDFDTLRGDLTPVSVFALLGVLLTMLIAGAVMVWGLGMSWQIALLFGTLIAATDPVSVVAVFRELGVAKRLSVLIESESLFNDGTSIVLFRLVLVAVLTGVFHPAEGFIEFARLVLGGIALGFGLGYVATRVLARIEDSLIEISLTVILAWGAYLLGETLDVSGVITTVVAGLVLGNLGGRTAFGPGTKIALEHILEFIAFVANSFIFLLIGLQVSLIDLRVNWLPMLWAIAAALVSRAIVVYGLSVPLRWIAKPIPLQWQHLLFWGGLRGGVTLALALSLPIDVPGRETLIVAAFGVVLFTLVVQGLTIRPLLHWLQLAPAHEKLRKQEAVRARLRAARAADRRLLRLLDKGTLKASTFQSMHAEVKTRADTLAHELEFLNDTEREIKSNEFQIARLESLRAQRSELSDLKRRGLISDLTYHQLVAEVDVQLHALSDEAQDRQDIALESPEETETQIQE